MRDSYHKPFRLLGEGYCYRLVLSHHRLHPDLSCIRTLFHDSAPCCVTSLYLTPHSPFHLASGFSGQRRARATSATSTTLLPFFGCFSSSFALWLVLVLCSLPFPLSSPFSLLCLDFLTKDCQGFQLLVSLSFPPDCTLLPHCLVRRLSWLPCINLWVREFLFSLVSCQGA